MANSGISVGGLVSGLDTNTIIDQLVQVEAQRVSRIESRQKIVEDKMESFDQLKGKIGEFASKAKSLSDTKAFNVYESTSSDEDAVTITGQENAITGTYKVEVASLATNLKVTSKSYNSIVQTLNLTGKFEISRSKEAIKNDPTKTTAEVEVDSGDTLKDIVNKINSTEGTGVKASLLNMGNNDVRLVLSAVDEGSYGFTIKDTGASNILDSAGLGVVDYKERIQSEFSFRMKDVGPADVLTQFTDVFTGIGLQSGVDVGDSIAINGKDALGNAVSGTFTMAAGSTVGDLLAEIKNVYESSGASVNVSLNSSGEVVVVDQTGGVTDMEMNLSFTDSNASGSTMQLTPNGKNGKVGANFSNILGEGRKAFYRLDGLSIASDSNKDEDTVTGTTFNLHRAELGNEIEVSLKRDDDALKKKMQDFLDSFNMILKFIDEKSQVKLEGEKDPNKKDTVVSRGPFAGDSQIAKIKNDLRKLLTEPMADLGERSKYTSLSTIGITSNSATGFLEIDDEDFKKALNSDFEGVRRIFTNSGFSDNPNHTLGRFEKSTQTGKYTVDADNNTINGVSATRIGDVLTATDGNSKGLALDAPAGTGVGDFTFIRGVASKISMYWENGTDRFKGSLTKTREAMEKSVDTYKEDAKRMGEKVDAYRSRLVRQFTDLETSMSRLQSQSATFQAQMAAL